jgi:tetratricopeptide (TPR) repeat protein
MKKNVLITLAFIFVIVAIAAAILLHPEFRARALIKTIEGNHQVQALSIEYPFDGCIFPPEIIAPVFRWKDTATSSDEWLVTIRYEGTKSRDSYFCRSNSWKPTDRQWKTIKTNSLEKKAFITVIGRQRHGNGKYFSRGEIAITTSKDPVKDPVFYREVVLPFADAVKDPSRIRWRFGSVADQITPPVVLENLPVCGNCHSFSANGKTLGMDVDYANDKGAYTVTGVMKEMNLVTSDIITWSDYKRDSTNPTFGLLSQVSPDGRFVVSTVKDRSVFVAKPDLTFSQLFFPIQGILAVYATGTKTFFALSGADDTSFVQSNPSWSPDGKYIVFARSPASHLKNLRDKAKALLSAEECDEFLSNQKLFKFDLYRLPFNDGRGGAAEPLPGASQNGMSNYFARFSPDGKWIVFCRANSFMLLQPDSRLYIMPAGGGEPRLMRCNTVRMNSWHSWSSNSRWLVFASKANTPYTQLFVTHIDEHGMDAPPVLLENFTSNDRAANIPEFVNADPRAIEQIHPYFIDDVSLWRAGMAFMDAREPENAKIKFLKALELNPKNVKAHISLGNVIEAEGDKTRALSHYTEAVRLDSTYAISRINVGNIFLNQGNFDKAIKQYQIALRLAPDDGFAHYNLAQAYVSLGRLNQAIAQFDAARKDMPNDAITCFAYATVLRRLGRTREALDLYAEAVNIQPDFKEALDSLAAVQKR